MTILNWKHEGLDESTYAARIVGEVGKTMFGLDDVVRLCLVAFYTGGHVLLEGNPGLGKTALVKSLAGVIGTYWGRIQFTPDLMPSDITGTEGPDTEQGLQGAWQFKEGPVFTSLLLADEINRAPPKTQSALLEAMAEGQVTVLGKTHRLPRPFMVLATQNPIEHEGTYRLPEALADRFMFKILMPTPDVETLEQIVDKESGPPLKRAGVASAMEDPRARDDRLARERAAVQQHQQHLLEQIKNVQLQKAVRDHLNNMSMASNRQYEAIQGGARDYARQMVEALIPFGLGPRAIIALALGAKAWAHLFAGGEPDTEQDASGTADRGLLSRAVRPDRDARKWADAAALARVYLPVVRHRLKLEYGWEERYKLLPHEQHNGGLRRRFGLKPAASGPRAVGGLDGVRGEELLDQLLVDFCLATAPTNHGYAELLAEMFATMRGNARDGSK